jgi:hypothetical protein
MEAFTEDWNESQFWVGPALCPSLLEQRGYQIFSALRLHDLVF